MPSEIPRLIASLEDVCSTPEHVAAVLAWALARTMRGEAEPANGHDRMLGAREAAQMLAVSASWLRRRDLPFRVRLGSRVVYSEKGIERYLKGRMGR